MKIRDLILAAFLLFIARSFAFAGGQLDKAEILQIFEMLTDQPRKTWIPTGVVEATHLEYKQSKGYITESTVIVKYDGDRFYWEINVESSTEQPEPQGSSDGISSRDTPDPNCNKKRVFAWDGERYTMYFRPGNHAIITENPNDIPVTVNGSLTAGIVPGDTACTRMRVFRPLNHLLLKWRLMVKNKYIWQYPRRQIGRK